MPSLRKRVTTYLRQLSFSAESRDRIGVNRLSLNKAGCSITRYIEGDADVISRGPTIHYGKTPQALPDLPIAEYLMGPETITAACTGPGDGLACVQRSCSHLSAGPDIDFIDIQQTGDDTTVNNQNLCKTKDNHSIKQNVPNKLMKKDKSLHDLVKSESETSSQINSNIINDINKNSDNSIEPAKNKFDGSEKRRRSITTIDNTTKEILNTSSAHVLTSEKKLDSIVISTSDTDSQSSVDVSLSKACDVNKELSKVEKEKLRLRNLPKYECRRTKTLSEMVLSRPRKDYRKPENVQNIVLVTKTLQVNAKTDNDDKQNAQTSNDNNIDNDQKSNPVKQSEESQKDIKNEKADTTNVNSLDISNSNIEKTQNDSKTESFCAESSNEAIPGVSSWDSATEHAFGVSTSLYEHNPILGDRAGQPIADCFGLIARGDAAILALADGVNWGNGAKLAACSAINGCLSYLNKAIFGLRQGDSTLTTREVFVSLLRSFWEAHACIIESGGALCTLTAAIILPLSGKDNGRSVVCVCNVGDSLAYVYSHVYGVREITQGSHDINSMRDMRDALGALGPVNGTNPELNNLTLSMTIVEPGDLVFLTSDGISDNFDPVVGRFAEAMPVMPQQSEYPNAQTSTSATTKSRQTVGNKKQIVNPVSVKSREKRAESNLAQSNRTNRIPQDNIGKNVSNRLPELSSKRTYNRSKDSEKKVVSIDPSCRPKFTRSQTTLEPRNKFSNTKTSESRPTYNRSMSGPENNEVPKKQLTPLPRSKSGLPIVNGLQRHDLTLLRIADLLNFGINGMLKPCTTSKALCKLLIDFVRMITTGKRKMLEEKELYYCEKNGALVQLTRSQQKSKRKEWIEKDIFKALPGKLDHATVVSFTIGACRSSKPVYCETDF